MDIISCLKNCIKKILCLSFKLLNKNVKVSYGKNCCFLNLKVITSGENKYIRIEKNVSLKDCRFLFYGANNEVVINKNSRLHNVTFWIEDEGNLIEIGEGVTTAGKVQFAACEGTKIRVGDDCMFSHDIYVRTTDSHSIINDSIERINAAKNVLIGNYFWIGMQALILKGSNIANNCIVGARCTVTSATKGNEGCIYAGAPAQIVKESINWNRDR